MKRRFFILGLLIMVSIHKLHAQTIIDSSSLASFTGKYQFRDNKMTFLQIFHKDGHIILKQLWDNQEIPFKQTGSLTFYNQDRSFPLVFTKNDSGKVTQVLAFNRDVWNKVPDNYMPSLQKLIHLPPAELIAFEGKYQLKEGDGDADDFVQIIAADDHLILKQLWNHQEVNIWPVSSVDFFNDKQTFPIKFTKAENGTVSRFLANNKDAWIKVK